MQLVLPVSKLQKASVDGGFEQLVSLQNKNNFTGKIFASSTNILTNAKSFFIGHIYSLYSQPRCNLFIVDTAILIS